MLNGLIKGVHTTAAQKTKCSKIDQEYCVCQYVEYGKEVLLNYEN